LRDRCFEWGHGAKSEHLNTCDRTPLTACCLEKRYDDRITTLRETADRYGAVVFDRPGH
jgi:hypothetical protein